MILLFLLLVVFGFSHVVSAVPAWRAAAIARLGSAYGPVYGIASATLLVAVIWAFRIAPSDAAYDVIPWGRYANYLLTWLAFLCMGVFLFRGSWRNSLRIPMTIAVLLWAAGHLLANNEIKSLILFGGMATIAAIQGYLVLANPNRIPGTERQGHNLLSMLGGTALFALMAQLHEVLIGVPVIALGN